MVNSQEQHARMPCHMHTGFTVPVLMYMLWGSGDIIWLAVCMGFLRLCAGSIFHAVVSPFHSLVAKCHGMA